MKKKTKSTCVMASVALLLLMPIGVFAANDDLSAILSKGLFEEEANHNLGAAIQAYRNVIDHFDSDRKMAATAVFRLGECYRKQGSTNEANAQYQRILREFADQAPLVTLSRQNLVALGGSPGANASSAAGQNLEKASALADASEIGRVEAIIKTSPDLINAPDQSGQTLLQNYAGRGDLPVVKLLLDSGAAVNGNRQPELTPLHYAAGNGHKAVVDFLLSKGAKTDVRTESGVTPLHIAVSKGYELVAKDLLDAGAPVNARVEQTVNRANSAELQAGSLTYDLHAGQTPLQIACEKGYHSLVDLLLAKGADVNANNGAALNAAVSANDEALVKRLLAAHADPNAGNAVALRTAAGRGTITMLDLLLTHSVNPNLNTCLEAAIAAKKPAAIKELIAQKADPNAKYPGGNPYIFAALSDSPTLAALLEGGADPNQRDPAGQSTLETALSRNNARAVEVLLTHGADPNLRNPTDGSTPLYLASAYGNTEAVKLLLQHGAKVNAQANNGQTPLLGALLSRRREAVEVLLDNGADPNLRDNRGQTPLDVARSLPASPEWVGYHPVLPPGTPMPESFKTKSLSITDLLRQHGASDDLPRFDRIEVRRFPNYTSPVFSRSTNDLNRFSLLEAIAAHYGFVSPAPDPARHTGPTYDGRSRTLLPFPNLDKIEIRRPKPGSKDWMRIPVSVQSILQSGDCSRDVWLHWGDQIEIPEADHPLDQRWSYFPAEVFTNLQKCITRTVRLTVKGQTTDLPLQMPLPDNRSGAPGLIAGSAPRFCLLPALDNSGLLRTSSDLSRVKVTRHNATTGENWERTFDCSAAPYPDLWLRDGDVIEVPDKP